MYCLVCRIVHQTVDKTILSIFDVVNRFICVHSCARPDLETSQAKVHVTILVLNEIVRIYRSVLYSV